MRTSDKTIINQQLPGGASLPSDFNKQQIDATLRDKGLSCLLESSLLCPCKSDVTAVALSDCKNCGGSGWIFVNPTKTKMIVTGLVADPKLKEAALRDWGLVDTGTVKLTAYDVDKLTYMDRVTVLDATAEHQQLLYPALSDDETTTFAYSQYNLVSILFIGVFVDSDTKVQKLAETTDYSFVNNVLTFVDPTLKGRTVTIRYRHRPVFHVTDVLRESLTSTVGQYGSQTNIILPVHALAKRAHLIKDVENLQGDRLLDNSWAVTCAPAGLTKFQRQLRYAPVTYIFATLTEAQKVALAELLGQSDVDVGDFLLLESGDDILLE